MLIVLEGPDYAGKSSLASSIRTRLEADHRRVITYHAKPPKAHPLNEYVMPLLTYSPLGDVSVICDRWHLGETVYPYVLNRPSRLDVPILNYIEMFLMARGVSITVLRPTLTELQRRSERGDDLIGLDILPEVWRRYEEMAAYSEPSRTPDEIIAHAEGRARWASPVASLVTYVGHPAPRVVYVGDVRNCQGLACRHTKIHSPFGTAFMPYPATSGHYLMTSLMGNLDPRCGLINACDVDDIGLAYGLLHAPSMVALGVRAHKRLEANGIPHAVAPHPQYVRRFHYTASHEYGRLLQSLVGTERNEMKWRPSLTRSTASGRTRPSSSRSSRTVSPA